MFFINHSQIEASLNDTKSKLNAHEAKFIVRLARYLILQQYKVSQITILTTYSAQLFQVKQLMRSDTLLNGVRATVLDNYQGEECDIILLSFVRSNIEGDIGFLKVSNRVNVALSRARMGMYCIGNFDFLAEKSDLWKNIRIDLIKEESIGNALELYCQNHKKKNLVSEASDFSQVAEGGCDLPCDYRLECGHVCPRACHIYDNEHKTVTCPKKCDQIVCHLKHRCPDRCHFGYDCQPCAVRVKKVKESCGHEIIAKCSTDPKDVFCPNSCEKVLICGHRCTLVCGADCYSKRCKSMVEIDSICGDRVEIECSKQSDIESQLKSCTKDCGVVLECGHLCGGNCGKCHQKRLHKVCQMKCERTLICGHICKAVCGLNCPPCQRDCQNICIHSKCYNKCGIPCEPCREPCVWKCEHKKCNQKCSEKCDRDVCDKECPKRLKCKHKCIGLCGEPCPQKCRICHKNQVQEILFGDEDEPNARFIQLQDCGHVIEFNGLLKWLNQTNDSNGADTQTNEIQMKCCPKCKKIILKSKIFNSIIQQSLRDVALVKQLHYGSNEENKNLAQTLGHTIYVYYLGIGGEDFIKRKNIKSSILRPQMNGSNVIRAVDSSDLSKVYKLFSQTESKYISKSDLFAIENKFEIIKKLIEFKNSLLDAKNMRKCNKDFQSIDELLKLMEIRFNKFLKYIDIYYVNNKQQIMDCKYEINCFSMISETLKHLNEKHFNEEGRSLLIEAFELLKNFGPFTDIIRDQFKSLVDKAIKLQGGLGISLKEKDMILKTMGYSRGHWYKCPNGHIYCIDACGGAMEESYCPECKCKIGGTNHALLPTNSVATEMDGATQTAYGPHVLFDLQQFID